MPSRHHLALLARHLRERLNGRAFVTLARMDITSELRLLSNEEGTRMKSQLAADLERSLLEQGVRCYPSLVETTTGDTIRLFHAGSVLGSLVDLLIYPSTESDRDLGAMLSKIKGKWQWATPSHSAAAAEGEATELRSRVDEPTS